MLRHRYILYTVTAKPRTANVAYFQKKSPIIWIFSISQLIWMQGVPLHIVISQDLNAGQSQNMKIGNTSFERREEFKYLGTTLINQNSIQEEIKRRWK